MAITHSGPRPTRVWKARVLDVDIEKYTVTVVGMHEKKILAGVPWGSPYQHPLGEGDYSMPEVGAVCWVCDPSDGNTSFVVGWGPVANDGDFSNNRKKLNPGDHYIGTRDGNDIILRRGGVLEMGSTPLCRRFFLPVGHFIKDFAENYELNTLGGQLSWTVDRPETTTDGARPAHFVLSAKQFADDPNPVAVLEIGSHEDSDEHILSLIVRDSGKDGAKLKHSLFLDKTGNMTVVTKGDIDWKTEGNVTLTMPADKELRVGGPSADEPWTLGNVLKAALTELVQAGTIMSPTGPCTVNPAWKPKWLDNPETNILSKNKFTQRE